MFQVKVIRFGRYSGIREVVAEFTRESRGSAEDAAILWLAHNKASDSTYHFESRPQPR